MSHERGREKTCLGFLTRFDTNRAEQPQKLARGLILDLGSRGIVLSTREPRHEKTSFLHMRKQRRRSASR